MDRGYPYWAVGEGCLVGEIKMSHVNFQDAAHSAAKEVADLVIRKQKDYGPKNILNSVVQPELAIAVRLNDKLARLANLVQSGKTPENESLQDTADDIIGYGLVLKLVLNKEFELPMKKDK
ncbi:hypothetical protein EBZ38_12700 [bacterium]|nr:hypothetical protein [bacterium]NDD85116.1 hypothetical protein [bacterium]